MHSTRLALLYVASALLFPGVAAAQAPISVPTEPPPPPRIYPAPTNLKVLPKTMTGQQVHDLMEHWADALGAHCNACHTADPKNIAPNGRPRLNFADDAKPEKATARLMFSMTEQINRDYLAKVDNSGAPVNCGTCHRGHLGPEPFTAPPEDQPARPK